jgi:hypothetical protein
LSLAAIDRDAALINAIRATGMEKHMVFAGSIHRLVLAVATFCGIGDDQVYQWFNIVFLGGRKRPLFILFFLQFVSNKIPKSLGEITLRGLHP